LVRAPQARRPAAPGGPGTLLDVGCGEGSHLAALCSRFPQTTGIGVDLSTSAIDLAARSHPELTWIVTNADRGLSLQDSSVEVALSITARRPVAELARVLRTGGHLVIVVPAPDDLAELRANLLGGDDARYRFATVHTELESVPGAFEILDRRIVRHRTILGPEALRDLAATTYRGGRNAREERLSALPADGMEVTGAWELVSARRL
jgi:23S rRNA (guanine745-N1)-methyltransferase